MKIDAVQAPIARHVDVKAIFSFALAFSLIGPLSIDAFLPGVNSIESDFAISSVLSATLLSFYLGAYAFMALWHGTLTDTLGRRTAALATIALYAAASAGCAVASSFWELQLGRIAQGLVSGAGLVVARAMLRDVFVGVELQRRFSILVACLALPPVAGPLLGGAFVELASWRAIFYGLSTLSIALAFIGFFFMPETLPKAGRTPFRPVALLSAYRVVLSRSTFLLPIGTTAFLFAGQFVYVGGSPSIIVSHYGLGPNDFAQIFIPITVGIVLGGLVGARAARTIAPERQAIYGLVIALAAAAVDILIAVSRWSFPPLTFTPGLFYAFGTVLVTPVATARTLARAGQTAGIVSSCQVFLFTLGLLASAWMVVPYVEKSLVLLACAKASLCAVACILWVAAAAQFRHGEIKGVTTCEED